MTLLPLGLTNVVWLPALAAPWPYVTWLGWLAAAWPWLTVAWAVRPPPGHGTTPTCTVPQKKKLQHVQYSMQNKGVKDDPSNG